ncbi:MAG: hypothetical protein Cons2KO_10540 [Congregibacter sp.]
MKALKYLLATALLSGSGFAHSNLIINGGFEHHNIASGWTYGPDTSGGWQGGNIEVWASGFNGVESFEGDNHAELNAHSNSQQSDAWMIYQSFNTVQGGLYEVGFAYRARRNHAESCLFELLDENMNAILSGTMDQHEKEGWSTYANSFRATGDTKTIRFTSITPEAGTVGNFLDAVSVTQVPVPAVPSLMLAGLLGFGLSRRAKS